MLIRFSSAAKKDINEIYAYLKIENPKLAKPTIQNIKNSIQTLIEFPQKGRVGLASNTREFIIPRLPYSVPYEIYKDTIYILRVYHNSRMPIQN